MANSSKTGSGMNAGEHLSEWETLAAKELRGRATEDLTTTSPDGLPIRPLYTAADLVGL
jgi:methylmalonyl-CoA mutase